MKLSHYIENNLCVVSIDDDLVLERGSEVRLYVAPFLENEQIKGMVISCKGTHFIDSSGMGTIASIYRELQKRQAPLVLCQLTSQNQEAFALTGLDKLIRVYPTEEAALEALKD